MQFIFFFMHAYGCNCRAVGRTELAAHTTLSSFCLRTGSFTLVHMEMALPGHVLHAGPQRVALRLGARHGCAGGGRRWRTAVPGHSQHGRHGVSWLTREDCILFYLMDMIACAAHFSDCKQFVVLNPVLHSTRVHECAYQLRMTT